MECPFCAEPVSADDQKCKSCGEFLTEERDVPAQGTGARTILIVVGAVLALGVLACVGFSAVSFFTYRSRVGAMQGELTLMDAEGLADGCEQYKRDVGAYPQALQDMSQDPGAKGWSGPYWMSNTDAWGNKWVYAQTATGISITSYGADGLPGGTGPNADIVVTRP